MDIFLALTLGTLSAFLIGLVVYCAGAIAIEVITTPISLAEDIIENRKKNK